MSSRWAHDVFFAFLLSEEEAANNRAQATRQLIKQHSKHNRSISAASITRKTDEILHRCPRPPREDEDADAMPPPEEHCHQAVKRESAPHKRHLKRGPPGEDEDATPPAEENCQQPVKRHRGGGRRAEEFLEKGGMKAFYAVTDFHVHFSMTRTQVEELLHLLQPHYPYKRGSKLPLENVVLAGLWVLASQESYNTIAERFQTSKSVICNSLHTFCSLVSGSLDDHIRWPVGRAVRGTVHGFQGAGFPGTVGALGATHVAIGKPKDVPKPDAYLKEEAGYSTTLLAVCDTKYRFTHVTVGHSGALDPGDVFKRSELYQALQDDPNSLLPQDFYLGDEVYSFHLIADAGFPLSEHVMTPYVAQGRLHPKQQEYNRQQLSALVVIARALGVLKARYRRLKFLQMQNLAQCSIAIKACCILHNICVQVSDVDTFGVEDVAAAPRHNSQANTAGQNKRGSIADALFYQ